MIEHSQREYIISARGYAISKDDLVSDISWWVTIIPPDNPSDNDVYTLLQLFVLWVSHGLCISELKGIIGPSHYLLITTVIDKAPYSNEDWDSLPITNLLRGIRYETRSGHRFYKRLVWFKISYRAAVDIYRASNRGCNDSENS